MGTLIRYVLFFAVSMGGFWYLRRTNRAKPVWNATLFVAAALFFLFIPDLFRVGTDTEGLVVLAAYAAAAIIPPVAIILALRKRN